MLRSSSSAVVRKNSMKSSSVTRSGDPSLMHSASLPRWFRECRLVRPNHDGPGSLRGRLVFMRCGPPPPPPLPPHIPPQHPMPKFTENCAGLPRCVLRTAVIWHVTGTEPLGSVSSVNTFTPRVPTNTNLPDAIVRMTSYGRASRCFNVAGRAGVGPGTEHIWCIDPAQTRLEAAPRTVPSMVACNPSAASSGPLTAHSKPSAVVVDLSTSPSKPSTVAVDPSIMAVDGSTRAVDRATERVERSTRSAEGSAGRVDRATTAADQPHRTVDRPLMPEEGEAPSSGTSIPTWNRLPASSAGFTANRSHLTCHPAQYLGPNRPLRE